MILRRLFVGMTLVFGLSVWSWCRAGDNEAHARPADEVYTSGADDEADECTQDEAASRYRAHQPHHWRHVMIGGR